MTDPRREGRLPAPSTALREPAHVALGAALNERELRAAVRARPDEVLPRGGGGGGAGEDAARQPRVAVGSRDHFAGGHGGGRSSGAPQEILLDPLLLLHPLLDRDADRVGHGEDLVRAQPDHAVGRDAARSEEHTSELQSHVNLVCRLLLEKKKNLSQAVGGARQRAVSRAARHCARRRERAEAAVRGQRARGRARLFFFNDTATTEIYTLSLHDALPI